jgi:hypothetical protein
MESIAFPRLAKLVASLPRLLALVAALGVTCFGWAGAPAQTGQNPPQTDAPAKLDGQTPPVVLDGRAMLVSHYDPSQKLRLAIVLAPPHPAEEDEFLEAVHDRQSPLFHQFLSPEEWNARFGPSVEDERAVVDWAKSQGLTITHRYPNRLIVDVEAPAGVIEKALRVTLNKYRLLPENEGGEERIAYSNDRDPELPSRLSGVVQSVQGLNSIETMTPASFHGQLPQTPDYVPGPALEALSAVRADGSGPSPESSGAGGNSISTEVSPPPPGYYTPQDLFSSKAYNYQALMNLGHCCNPLNHPSQSPPETSIAIATFGTVQDSDPLAFAQYFGLSINLFRFAVDGRYTCANTSKGPDNNCVEATLDTEWALATANSQGPAASTAAVFEYEGANYNNSTFIDEYNSILTENHARVMSTSWGCAEDPSSGSNGCTADTMRARDDVFKSMVGQGWTIVAASGDQGATAGCGSALHVQFPASSPFVVAVGGTELSEGTVSASYEVAWSGSTAQGSCGTNNGGSTGGVSEYWPPPAFQENMANATRRLVPDIALDAFYAHDVYLFGAWTGVGGTSVAAPMIAGFFAQENAYLLSIGNKCGGDGTSPCAPMGDPNYALYAEGTTFAAEHDPFYDILSGCNSNDITVQFNLTAFCAGPGYDEVTGWGSANMLQLAWAINQYTATAGGRPNVTFTGPKVNEWYNSNRTVKWTVNDNPGAGFDASVATGIAGFAESWDKPQKDPSTEPHGGTGNLFYSGPQFPNVSTGCLSLTGEDGCGSGVSQGCHTAYVHGWNNQGRTTAAYPGFPESYGPVCFDTIPPIVGILHSPPANGVDWNKTPVKLTINASDPGDINIGKLHVQTGSGIKHIYFGINDHCATTNLKGCGIYGGPFTLSKDGIYTILFFAEDNAGNFGSTIKGYERVMLDQIPPVTTVHVTGTLSGGVYTSPVGLVLGATDATSGVQYTKYELDSGPATYYSIGSSQAIAVSAPGSHTFKYWSIDYAGNVEAAHTLTFTISNATQVTLTATPNPALLGQAVLIKATVALPTGAIPQGTVTFIADGNNITIETLSGNGTVPGVSDSELPTGSHALTAIYTPSGGSPAITSAVVTEVVGTLQATLITLKSSTNPSVSGSPVTFTATVTAAISGIPTGTVKLMDGTKLLGTGTYNYPEATYTTSALSVGTHSITAVYSGDANYGTSSSAALAQVVNSATP